MNLLLAQERSKELRKASESYREQLDSPIRDAKAISTLFAHFRPETASLRNDAAINEADISTDKSEDERDDEEATDKDAETSDDDDTPIVRMNNDDGDTCHRSAQSNEEEDLVEEQEARNDESVAAVVPRDLPPAQNHILSHEENLDHQQSPYSGVRAPATRAAASKAFSRLRREVVPTSTSPAAPSKPTRGRRSKNGVSKKRARLASYDSESEEEHQPRRTIKKAKRSA